MKATILRNIELNGSSKDIYISDGVFSHILASGSPHPEGFPSDAEVVSCNGKSAFPSLANMHTHSGMNMMRGAGEDLALEKWLDSIWLIEENLSSDYIYWATRLACCEMIRTGTTFFNDNYWYVPTSHRAVEAMGLRVAQGYVILDRMDPEQSRTQKEQLVKTYERASVRPDEKWNPSMSRFTVCFHSVYTVSEEMLRWGCSFAREHGLKMHIHLSETAAEVASCEKEHGCSPVKYLDRLGLLGPDLIAAHTMHLDQEDIRLLGSNHVTCVHNINSNLKLGSGYRFLYNELRDAGANITLGTDGCASSNNLDMLETMKTSAMLQKAFRADPTAMPLGELICAATENAARAFDFGFGRIAPGYAADMLIVDTDSCFFLSNAPFEANFIYSAHSDSISSVLCGGEFLMRDRVIEGEEEILREARRVLKTLKL